MKLINCQTCGKIPQDGTGETVFCDYCGSGALNRAAWRRKQRRIRADKEFQLVKAMMASMPWSERCSYQRPTMISSEYEGILWSRAKAVCDAMYGEIEEGE